MKLFKKFLVSLIVAVGLIGATEFAQPKEAEAASGYILESFQNRVVGIWVHVEGGGSGWANFNPTTPGQWYSVNWSYDTKGKPFKLDIGIGGTAQNWGKNISTGWQYNYKNGGTFTIIGNYIRLDYPK